MSQISKKVEKRLYDKLVRKHGPNIAIQKFINILDAHEQKLRDRPIGEVIIMTKPAAVIDYSEFDGWCGC